MSTLLFVLIVLFLAAIVIAATARGGAPAPQPRPVEPRPTPPAEPETAFTERQVTVGYSPWALPGTLTMPRKLPLAPGVVLVHGSGPHDRDETIGPNKPFRDLAHGLATRGIAVLRYEKRTYAHRDRVIELARENSVTVQDETIEDCLEAVRFLSDQSHVDPERIFVLGHSLGGMLAPRIGDQTDELAGLILLAGAARPLEDLILEQVDYLLSQKESVSDDEKRALEVIRAQVARVKSANLSLSTPRTELPLSIPASYWLDLRGYNPAQVASQLNTPMLVLQGERDYQVTMADFAIWRQALTGKRDCTLKSYPGLNHLFMPGEGPSLPNEYLISGHVDERVIDDIAAFVKKHWL